MAQKEPILVIMAAGMGSRYGGLKQMDPVGAHGEIIIDFSIFDAIEAGFKRVIFITKKEIEADMREIIGDKVARHAEVTFVIQDLDKLPEGYSIPEGRTKPWGTGHAILCCIDAVDAPFAVINADDYYGKDAFTEIYKYLKTIEDADSTDYAMVGYLLENTVTDHGSVARGVCEVNENGYLNSVTERTKIFKVDGGIAFTEDEKEFTMLPSPCTVSMNFWGFAPSIMNVLKEGFPKFLDKALAENPMKGEYLLPSVVGELLQEGKCSVKVLNCKDKWYGVTYKEDKPLVVAAVKELKDAGKYPHSLWD